MLAENLAPSISDEVISLQSTSNFYRIILKSIWEQERASTKFSFLPFSAVLFILTAEVELHEQHFEERNSITCNNVVDVKRSEKK